MRILANRQIKQLFLWIFVWITGFLLVSVAAVFRQWEQAVSIIMLAAICLGASIFLALYLYFRKQEQIMEEAIVQIQEYISGNRDARINCDEEGELYRLFHEINYLAAILDAHAENEGDAKAFLKDTISNISHQLKTPLAALNIYNGLIQEEAKDLSEIKEFAVLCEQELDRIETLIQSLLKIAKLDSGTIVLEKAAENLADIMDFIERHFAYQAVQEEKQLIFSGDDSVMLLCDRAWMTEAISNLVKNAFEHTIAGNTIYIKWEQFASIIQIIIKDNGMGIHPEDLPHIFKRFYRSRFSKETQGVGLGLAFTKAVVEAHDGTIEVDSDLGGGTKFTLNFLIPTKM